MSGAERLAAIGGIRRGSQRREDRPVEPRHLCSLSWEWSSRRDSNAVTVPINPGVDLGIEPGYRPRPGELDGQVYRDGGRRSARKAQP